MYEDLLIEFCEQIEVFAVKQASAISSAKSTSCNGVDERSATIERYDISK